MAALAQGLLALVLTAGVAVADTAQPTATTATYGNWTVGCSSVAQADGTAPQQMCQMTTRLNLKGQDGQMRPLLTWTIGTPPGAKVKRLALQLPTNLALREAPSLSLDKPGAGSDDPPQDEIAALAYVTCTPQACVADADGTAEVLDKLAAAKTANVSFTLLQGGQRVRVPVSLDGFSAALAALAANEK